MASMNEDLPVRIFARAIGFLLDRKHGEGICVKVDDMFWNVSCKQDQIVINLLPNNKGFEDGCLITSHDTNEDAIIAAATDLRGKFVDL